jgi:hypothetical protein
MSSDKIIDEWSIMVAGDTIVDRHIYLGERFTPNEDLRALRDFWEPGGAVVLYELLRETMSRPGGEGWKVHLAARKPDLRREQFSRAQQAFAIWKPHARQIDEKNEQVWRAQDEVSYGKTEAAYPGEADNSHPVPTAQDGVLAKDLPEPDILVLEDAGLGFWKLDKETLLSRLQSNKFQWIVVKMSHSVERAPLWKCLSERFPERLVCLVSAYKLRGRYVNIARGLSWQRAVEDLREEWRNNAVLAELGKAQHLIVSFSADGALWLNLSDKKRPRANLVFDPRGAEGEWIAIREGEVPRYSVNIAAAITRGLANHCRSPDKAINLIPSIISGLGALRGLVDFGHGKLAPKRDEPAPDPKGFPTKVLANYIAAPEDEDSDEYGYARAFSHAELAWRPKVRTPETSSWTIVEALERRASADAKLVEVAFEIVVSGMKPLSSIPHARFRELRTVDRIEIETLRSLWRRMRAYKKESQSSKPLSIGVFGPPGAGKSFGVEQIVHEVFGSKAWLNFNLSQYDGSKHLIGAFHQVRDKALSGETPVAFWDEFDSLSYNWLKYFLAPMQDGRFQEEQLSHWIGKCVFVFAGGTSDTFDAFGKENKTSSPEGKLIQRAKVQQFNLNKGPDFRSRLDGYYDVKGPNPPSESVDARSLLQRALMIRAILGNEDDRISFDPGLLNALLRIPKYTHGARSLKKIAAALQPKHGSVHRSALPLPTFLGLHVDMPTFTRLLNAPLSDSLLSICGNPRQA